MQEHKVIKLKTNKFIDYFTNKGLKYGFIIVENQILCKIGYILLLLFIFYGKKFDFLVIYKIF